MDESQKTIYIVMDKSICVLTLCESEKVRQHLVNDGSPNRCTTIYSIGHESREFHRAAVAYV